MTQTIKSAANLKLHKNKEEKKNSKRESFEDVYKLTLICESEKEQLLVIFSRGSLGRARARLLGEEKVVDVGHHTTAGNSDLPQ